MRASSGRGVVTPDLAQQAGVLPYRQRQHDRKEGCSKHVMLAIHKGKSCASQKGWGSQKFPTFSAARWRRTEGPAEFHQVVPKIPRCDAGQAHGTAQTPTRVMAQEVREGPYSNALGGLVTPHHLESSTVINASAEDVFAFVDDHARLSSHMNESSWMMGGGRMSVDVDAAQGQAVGSHIRLSGRVFGIRLHLDEVVTLRDPPVNKVWETVGVPRLLVIGAYKIGVQITPVRDGSRMRVFIDYELPKGWLSYSLGFLFGRFYAKWCINQMLEGVVEKFAKRHHPAAA